MKEITYNNIKKLIENYKQNHLYFWKKIEDKDLQNDLLRDLLSMERLSNLKFIDSMILYEFLDFKVIDYKTYNQEAIVNNLVIFDTRKEIPVFDFSEEDNMTKGSGIKHCEYRLYDNDKRIILQAKKNDKFIDNLLLQSQVVLTEKISSTSNYLIKHYDFLYKDNECCFLGIDDNYIVVGSNSFVNRYKLADSYIQKFNTVFESYINTTFGLDEITKVYQIKRKVKNN